MSIGKIPAERLDYFVPAGQSGSYVTSRTLQAGVYLVETDTSQDISASNFYVESAEGFRFAAPIKGGQAYVVVPTASNTVQLAAGAFPVPLNFQKSDYALEARPSASYSEYAPAELFIEVGLPDGATGFSVYWPDGTSASVSGSSGSVTVPPTAMDNPPVINGVAAGFAVIDTNNVVGQMDTQSLVGTYVFAPAPTAIEAEFYNLGDIYLAASTTGASVAVLWNGGSASTVISGSAASISPIPYSPVFTDSVTIEAYSIDALGYGGPSASFDLGLYPWIEYIGSDTFVPPPGVTSVDVYSVGGGGGAITSAPVSPSLVQGGAGGGQATFTPAVPVAGPVTVTIGAGGSGTTGTATTFGPAVSSAGGLSSTAQPGGASGSGNAGGPGSPSSGGGGGGDSAVGVGSGATGGDGGAGWTTSGFGVPVGGGGGGGSSPGGTAGLGVDGGGNGGVAFRASPGGTAISVGGTGVANRGGGSGGGAGHRLSPTPFVPIPAANGGSGRVVVKAIF